MCVCVVSCACMPVYVCMYACVTCVIGGGNSSPCWIDVTMFG